jgi:hypothetical protein
MQVHAKREFVLEMKEAIYPIGKEVQRSDGINIIGPIDQQSAPDHHEQNGKVDPVEPAYRE